MEFRAKEPKPWINLKEAGEMLIYGTGEHGRVVYDCLLDNGEAVQAFFDDNLTIQEFENHPVKDYLEEFHASEAIIVAIGSNIARKRVLNKIRHRLGTVIHRSSIISRSAQIKQGSMIMHGTILQTGCKIGICVIVNTGATIDHDCNVRDFCHIAPNATLCGKVSIGEGTLVGAGSVIIPGINVGKWSIIGAGSVVVRDVPDYTMVVGNPARIFKPLNRE